MSLNAAASPSRLPVHRSRAGGRSFDADITGNGADTTPGPAFGSSEARAEAAEAAAEAAVARMQSAQHIAASNMDTARQAVEQASERAERAEQERDELNSERSVLMSHIKDLMTRIRACDDLMDEQEKEILALKQALEAQAKSAKSASGADTGGEGAPAETLGGSEAKARIMANTIGMLEEQSQFREDLEISIRDLGQVSGSTFCFCLCPPYLPTTRNFVLASASHALCW